MLEGFQSAMSFLRTAQTKTPKCWKPEDVSPVFPPCGDQWITCVTVETVRQDLMINAEDRRGTQLKLLLFWASPVAHRNMVHSKSNKAVPQPFTVPQCLLYFCVWRKEVLNVLSITLMKTNLPLLNSALSRMALVIIGDSFYLIVGRHRACSYFSLLYRGCLKGFLIINVKGPLDFVQSERGLENWRKTPEVPKTLVMWFLLGLQ